jgi:hypothetical protein
MQKANQLVVGSELGGFVEQRKALVPKPFHLSHNIIDLKGDVMNSLAFFLDKPGDRTAGISGFEQLYLGLVDPKK